jgi:transglutaminase-like putative cysteine protease
LALLLAATALIVAPHLFNLDAAVMVAFFALTAWRAALLHKGAALPKRPALLSLTLAGIFLVYQGYRRFWGLEAGAALLTMGLGLKLMELKTSRDAYLVVYLCCFVAVTQYLFSQTIPMALYTLAVVTLLVAAMIGFNSGEGFSTRERLRLAAVMTVQALPMAVLLFVLFPRIPGPLWQLPDERRSAKSGLSEEFAPGAVSRLGLSQETAFRVDFEGEPPPPAQRYWRGPVFWRTDGRNWTQATPRPWLKPVQPAFEGSAIRYAITLEPHHRRWIFALELPSAFPAGVAETLDHQLLASADINERKRFSLESKTHYSTGPLSAADRAAALALPFAASPRLAALIAGWRKNDADALRLANRALRFFREESFYYTLNPPPLSGKNPMDEFLFESRRGFCEHFAASFALMMRAAGVPARIVTGYQGGHWNGVGKFLEVKQADAHAWAEIWVEGAGWTRMDPTAAVAPERIESGLDVDNQIDAGEIRFNATRGNFAGGSYDLRTLWFRTRQLWESVDHAWSRWVLSYGPENQASFLSWLDRLDWRALALGLSGALLPVAGVVFWILRPKRARPIDPVLRIHRLFLRKMAARGFSARAGEGPRDFSRRAQAQAPELAEEIEEITRLYLRLRYERTQNPDDMKNLARKVGAFNPRRRRFAANCG